MSWTNREFKSLIKGSQHRIIDQYELMAKTAMANRIAQHKKRVTERQIYNAAQARRNLEKGVKSDKNIERLIDLNHKFKGFKPTFIPKGG